MPILGKTLKRALGFISFALLVTACGSSTDLSPGPTLSSTSSDATFTATPAFGQAPLRVIFDTSDFPISSGKQGYYGWKFGDGLTKDEGKRVEHIYEKPGNYSVVLSEHVTFVDAFENKQRFLRTRAAMSLRVSASPSGLVKNKPPIAFFTMVTYSCEKVYFNASASDDVDGEIVDYTWDFGDGTGIFHGEKVFHRFPSTKSLQRITLTVRDNGGKTSRVGDRWPCP